MGVLLLRLVQEGNVGHKVGSRSSAREARSLGEMWWDTSKVQGFQLRSGSGPCSANGKWSQDALAESHGVSFASIACAVIASVALVFIVLSVAKKNSHLEVAVADE